MSRYRVVEGSETAHCCFGATVVDTARPEQNGDGEPMVIDGKPYFYNVCECIELADAEMICTALNKV